MLKDIHLKKHVSSSHFNGSEDDVVKIEGINDYKIPLPKRKSELPVKDDEFKELSSKKQLGKGSDRELSSDSSSSCESD